MKITPQTAHQKQLNRVGFSLLEVILVVTLLGLIVTAIYPFFGTTVSGWEVKDRQTEVLQIGRAGMDDIIRSLKGATTFSTAKANEIKFEDVDGDDVKYKLSKGVVELNKVALIEPVDSLTFTYYDQDGAETSDKSSVRLVKIALVISDSESKVSPVTFSSIVMPRKDYLAYSLAINEINYNPVVGKKSKEEQKEWVEVYNFGTTSVDLDGWTIEAGGKTDSIGAWKKGTTIIPSGGYAIIVAKSSTVFDDYTYDGDAIRLMTDDSKIGNKLGDNSDTIVITSAGTVTDTVTYDDAWGGDEDGDTIERIDETANPSTSSNWEASSDTGTYTAGAENTTTP
ncbi:MAG: hypothetical protein GY858_09270 [Candidatus Omnitrophica bacterium]|nr:hypothetical protein [Candidatus Omnitrophota bacterium]